MAIDIRGVCPLLQAFDMQRSVTFYRDVLGFEVQSSSPSEQWALRAAERSWAVRLWLDSSFVQP